MWFPFSSRLWEGKMSSTYLQVNFTVILLFLLMFLLLLKKNNQQQQQPQKKKILKWSLLAKCLTTYFCMTCHHSPSWSQSCSDRSVSYNCCLGDRCANSPLAVHMYPLHRRGFWLQQRENKTRQLCESLQYNNIEF